jgi:hypothetical protein
MHVGQIAALIAVQGDVVGAQVVEGEPLATIPAVMACVIQRPQFAMKPRLVYGLPCLLQKNQLALALDPIQQIGHLRANVDLFPDRNAALLCPLDPDHTFHPIDLRPSQV